MHEALVYALRYALNMTQDASHNKEELKLRTDEYAREVHSNHIFSSILHITMDYSFGLEKQSKNLILKELLFVGISVTLKKLPLQRLKVNMHMLIIIKLQ